MVFYQYSKANSLNIVKKQFYPSIKVAIETKGRCHIAPYCFFAAANVYAL